MSNFSNQSKKAKPIINKTFLKSSLVAGAFLFSGINQSAQANSKPIVAVEPLVCDVVSAIAPPSTPVTCLIDRKQDVHDVKITPRQAQTLKSANQVFTLGSEMTPAMKKWLDNPLTVVVGVSAIEIDDHHDDHDDHSASKDDDHDDHSAAKHDDHDDHDDHSDSHGEGDFEWAGVFDLSAGTYKWSFAKVDGDYADPAMKMVILNSGDIEASEELAKELLGSKNSETKRNNDKLVAQEKAYFLSFNEKRDTTTFTVEIKKAGKYAFFTEHMPFEFEADEHFFKDISGDDVEPIAQVPDEGDHHHHHDHGGLDPHIWHDPHNIIKMGNVISKNINKKISFFDRETKKVLKERTEAVNSILEDLDLWTQKQVATIPTDRRTIVSKHKAMEYYGDAFGLKTLSLLDFLGDSSSLRPETISTVIAELKEENVNVLFAEQKPPSKLLKNLSRQTSTPIARNQIFVDGLMLEGNTVSVAVHNTCTIVDSLGGECDEKEGDELESKWNDLTNP
ncbi:metal ABC transporter solute-binding protein, Zn/Mn family [Prochlorococcus sp. MIT 0801]|uniref:metal ABC transporter solute-binding protein, Zn/Mn family n=1 Tax=Prochlorococcus sp. MIT 0801 TaxID=1501269 RepID=UPI0004F6DA7F|nr:zinc ABC transporter substrate-binding protein [Prochlorococcus sp. MIT 0801]AIQ98056.1 Zinc ABC transporter [Prochlorococcus sp. MIT 0801]